MAEAAEKVSTAVVSITNHMAHDHALHDADFHRVLIKAGETVDGVTMRESDIQYHRRAQVVEKKRGEPYLEITSAPVAAKR